MTLVDIILLGFAIALGLVLILVVLPAALIGLYLLWVGIASLIARLILTVEKVVAWPIRQLSPRVQSIVGVSLALAVCGFTLLFLFGQLPAR